LSSWLWSTPQPAVGYGCCLLTGCSLALVPSDESLLVGGEVRRTISSFGVLGLVSRAGLAGDQCYSK